MAQEHRSPATVDDEEVDYQAQLAAYPRLSDAEQDRLLATHGVAREAANRTLIEHNLHLVFEAARHHREEGIAFGDLFQEGSLALISAVEHYRGTEQGFTDTLKGAITATMDAVVAMTRDAQHNDEAFVAACRVFERAQQLLSADLKRPATDAEIAKLLAWDVQRVGIIRAMLRGARQLHDEDLLPYLEVLDEPNGDEPDVD
ncbi:MAG TPA: sigma factor [Candidatus Eisenbacteria bacterium]|nr:sigma factor [Candidatus Eisenbacteria bacterium]